MTIDELQSHVRLLSNGCHVRWWAHWNYPQQSPWLMAISCMDFQSENPTVDLAELGFNKKIVNGRKFWTVERTNEDGTPFRSEL